MMFTAPEKVLMTEKGDPAFSYIKKRKKKKEMIKGRFDK